MNNERQSQTVILLLGLITVLLLVIAGGVITLMRKTGPSNAVTSQPASAVQSPVVATSSVPPAIQRQIMPPDETTAIRQAVMSAVPGYIHEYHTVDGVSATILVHTISVSQTSTTEAVGIMTYTASTSGGTNDASARCLLRKYDSGWKAETMQPE